MSTTTPKNLWVDQQYDKNGVGIWLLIVAWLVVLNIDLNLIYFLKNYIEQYPPIFVYGLGAVLTVYLVSGLSFFMQCFKTAKKISYDGSGTYILVPFLGRKLVYNKENLKGIENYFPSVLSKSMTPLTADNNNQKLMFKDGKSIYIAGRLDNLDELISDLIL